MSRPDVLRARSTGPALLITALGIAGALAPGAFAHSVPAQGSTLTAVAYPVPVPQVVPFVKDGKAVRYEGSAGPDLLTLTSADAHDDLTGVTLGGPADNGVLVQTGAAADVVRSSLAGVTVESGDGGDAVVLHARGIVRAGAGDDVVHTTGPSTMVDCGPGDDTVRVSSGAPRPTVQSCEHVVEGSGASSLVTTGLVDHVVGGPFGTQRLAGPQGFTYGLAGGGAGAECATDAGAWEACHPAATPRPSLPADGMHAVQMRARTADGVRGLPAFQVYFQDTTAPAPPSFLVEPAPVVAAGHPITWLAQGAIEALPSTLETSMFPAGGTPAWTRPSAGAAASAVESLPPGAYTIALRSVDPVGNVSTEVRRDFRGLPPTTPEPKPPFTGKGPPDLNPKSVGLPANGRKQLTRGLLILRCPKTSCEARISRNGATLAKASGRSTVVLRLSTATQRRIARSGALRVRLSLVAGDGRRLARDLVLVAPRKGR